MERIVLARSVFRLYDPAKEPRTITERYEKAARRRILTMEYEDAVDAAVLKAENWQTLWDFVLLRIEIWRQLYMTDPTGGEQWDNRRK